MSLEVERAVARRESASARVRNLTAVAVVAGTGLTAALAAVAGASTHLRHTVARRAAHPLRSTHAKPVVAPAAPLVAIHEAQAAQPAAPAAPAPAPAPAVSAPVAVSGGS